MAPNISDLDAYQAGSGAADFSIAAANAARNFSCGLFSLYPGAIIPNAADDFVTGLWNGFCKNSSSGLPAPPEIPFTGGQCAGTRYEVRIEFDLTSSGGTFHEVVDDNNVYGPIGAIYQNSGVDSVGDCLGFTIDAFTFTGAPYPPHGSFGGGAPYSIANFTVAVSVVSGPDNCGNPPITFPQGVEIPTADLQGTQTLDLPGGFSPSLQFTFPTPIANINVAPIVAVAAVNASIIPQFNVTADMGGLHIGAGGNLTQTQLSQISAIDKNTSPPKKPTNPGITPTPRSPSDNAPTGLSNLAYVRITLTKLPSEGAIQAGKPPAPNVLFTGWFEYSLGGIPQGRVPICFDDQIFINDADFDGYSYTLTRYAEGYATEYYNTGD